MNITAEQERKLNMALQELALTDFTNFCKMIGADKEQAYICMERSKGKSYQQISNITGIPKSTVRNKSNKCAD